MSEPEPIRKDVQVEDTRRVIVTFTRDAIEEMVRREVGVPEGATNFGIDVSLTSGAVVTWEVSLNG